MYRLRGLLLLCALGVRAQFGFQYGDNHAPFNPDSEIVSQAFPEVDGVELLSPAFMSPETVPAGWSNGTEGPTDLLILDKFDHAPVHNYIRTLASRNSWMNYIAGDFLSEEGRQIPYLYLSTPSQNSTKLRVYIQAAIHGNEPAADQAALALLGKMDADQEWTAALLEKMDIKMLPRYNVDGVAHFQRELASYYDPNREHLKLFRQQSREVKKVFSEFSPHVSIDLHEYTADRIWGGAYRHGADALISGGINPNIHADIRAQVLDNFIPAMGGALEAKGIRWEPYVTGTTNSTPGSRIVLEEAVTEARTGRNAYGLTQTISFLLETRGIRLADQHFQRRVATALVKLQTILDTAAAQFDDVYGTVERARREFVAATDDIVVTDSYTPENRTFTMVDVRNGSVVQAPVEFWATTPSVANLTRARPEAYLIPRPWRDVVERLEILGLEVETLDHEFVGTVEVLNITSSVLDTEVYEGAVLNTVTTRAYDKEVRLPPGSFRVSTRQKNAALAFITLEPENIDSYVTFNLVPVVPGDEYPIFRIMK